jgi:hypothetical protein
MSATDEKQRHRQMIEEAIERQGLTAEAWRYDEDDQREQVTLGRWRIVEDDEDRGLYADDEGVLYATVVGAAQYSNERVALYLQIDGTDVAEPIHQLDEVEPVT